VWPSKGLVERETHNKPEQKDNTKQKKHHQKEGEKE
jgi:hypothetical protein